MNAGLTTPLQLSIVLNYVHSLMRKPDYTIVVTHQCRVPCTYMCHYHDFPIDDTPTSNKPFILLFSHHPCMTTSIQTVKQSTNSGSVLAHPYLFNQIDCCCFFASYVCSKIQSGPIHFQFAQVTCDFRAQLI